MVAGMPPLDPTFTVLPLAALADAALSRARDLGASHADLRVVRIKSLHRVLRDAKLEGSSDSAPVRTRHSPELPTSRMAAGGRGSADRSSRAAWMRRLDCGSQLAKLAGGSRAVQESLLVTARSSVTTWA